MSTAQTEEVQLKRFKDGMELLTKMTSAVVEQFEGITGNLQAIKQHCDSCREEKERLTGMATEMRAKLDTLVPQICGRGN